MTATSNLHPLQSKAWVEAKQQLGTKYYFFEAHDEKTQNLLLAISIHTAGLLGKFGYIARSALPSSKSLMELQKFARSQNLIAILFEPNLSTIPDSLAPFLVPSRFSLFPKHTLTLDLKKSETELLQNMHSKTRYNIRLAQKKGVKIISDNSDASFDEFIQLYFQTCKRQKYFGHNREYHQTIFSNMKASGQAQLMRAMYENQSLAAYELFWNDQTLYYPYGGTSVLHKEKMASTLLMWEAILFGKSKGLKIFDLWGAASPDSNPNDSWNGFTRFKLGFGAEYQEMAGSFWLVCNDSKFGFLTNALKFRKYYLDFMRIFI